jgi:hypothetical protein
MSSISNKPPQQPTPSAKGDFVKDAGYQKWALEGQAKAAASPTGSFGGRTVAQWETAVGQAGGNLTLDRQALSGIKPGAAGGFAPLTVGGQGQLNKTQGDDLKKLSSDHNQLLKDIQSGDHGAAQKDMSGLNSDLKKMFQDGFSKDQVKGALTVAHLEDSAAAIKSHISKGASITDPATRGFINNAYANWCRANGADPSSNATKDAFSAALGSQLKAATVSPEDIKKALGAQGLTVPRNLGKA